MRLWRGNNRSLGSMIATSDISFTGFTQRRACLMWQSRAQIVQLTDLEEETLLRCAANLEI